MLGFGTVFDSYPGKHAILWQNGQNTHVMIVLYVNLEV